MPDTVHPPGVVATVLVGRERELTTLRGVLAAAFGGRGSLVLIGGEAGIGKTALAETFLAEAQAQGVMVLAGRCYDLGDTPPYGPWIEAFDRAPGDDSLPALPAAVLPPGREGAALASQEANIRRVRDYLAELAARQPLVLLLEDLHWADLASLETLRVVARALAGLPLLLLATYRDDEPPENRPLTFILPALVRESRATRLELRPLDEAAIGELVAVRYALSDADRGRLTAHLTARTEGNALYLGEVLRTFEEEGALRAAPGGDGWTLGQLAEAHVPPLLRQIIAARAARLGPEFGRLLAVASVIGQEVPLDLWAAVSESAEEMLSEAVERAIAARLLAELPDGAGLRFGHALVREALYEAIPLPRRRAHHRRVAEALQAGPSPDPDAVAYHLRRAGDPRAVEWLIEAGHRAHRDFARGTAAERYEAALRLVGDNAVESGRRGWILVYLAQARYLKDARGSIALLEEAERLALVTDDRALAAYARYHLGTHRSAAGDWRRGVAEMIEAATLLDSLSDGQWEETWGDRRNNSLEQRLAYTGHYRALYARLQRHSGRALPPPSEFALGEAEAALGQATAAKQTWVRGREGARRTQDYWSLGLYTAFELHGTILPYWTDDLDLRRCLAREAEAALRALDEIQGLESVRFGSLALLALEGEWAEACAIASSVLASNRAYRPIAASLLAEIAHAQGDYALAWSLIHLLLPGGPDEEPGGTWHHDGLRLQRLGAALARDTGDLATAQAWLAAHDRWLDWNGAVRGRADGQIAWAAYHRAAGDLSIARDLAELALDHASDPRQPLALLAAHRILGELAADSGDLSEAATRLEAAQILADTCAAPYERALTLVAIARLHLRNGRPGPANEALAEARSIGTGLGAHPLLARCNDLTAGLWDAECAVPVTAMRPPAATAPTTPAGLTAREVEVLRLVAAGRSNREMAAALSRSERTIERHLENIYRKIDARNRADAVAFALRHQLA